MNRWTIKKKLTVLITLALVVSVGFFTLCYYMGKRIVFKQTMRGINERDVEKLNQYIEQKEVKAGDSEALMYWCRKIGEMDIEVFLNEQLVFSSVFDLSKRDYTIAETGRDKEKAVRVRFADGEADVLFYKLRGLQIKMIMIGVMLALLLFYSIVVIGIRREVDYIHTINEEIHILEGGDLTREITIKGSSEITTLAESVDEFRKSLQAQLSTIERLESSNRLMAAEIAHDLRTPLTSLIMYLDFAEGEIRGKEPQAEEYLGKAREKSVRLKNLLDQNFDYVTMKGAITKQKQEVPAYDALSGYLGDILIYLEGEGFHVRSDVSYGNGSIVIQREGIGRVFSNLLSNITKYARRDTEVFICCKEKENCVEIRFVNSVRIFEEGKPESTGFGNRIIKRLMEEMDGEYTAEETDGIYTTELRFLKVADSGGRGGETAPLRGAIGK